MLANNISNIFQFSRQHKAAAELKCWAQTSLIELEWVQGFVPSASFPLIARAHLDIPDNQ